MATDEPVINKPRKFTMMEDLFVSLQVIRRKYPMIVTHLKFLRSLDSFDKWLGEMDAFKKFLRINYLAITESVLDDWYYKGTRKGSPIYFRNVVGLGSDECIESFWNQMKAMQTEFFTEAEVTDILTKATQSKEPTPSMVSVAAAAATDTSVEPVSAFQKIVATNPLLAEITETVRESFDTTPLPSSTADISSMLTSPCIPKLVNKIQSGLSNGTYTLDSLTSVAKDLLQTATASTDKNSESGRVLNNVANICTDLIDKVQLGGGGGGTADGESSLDLNQILSLVGDCLTK